MHLTHLPHLPLDFQGSLEVGFSTDTIIKETATFDSKFVLEHDISPFRNQQEKSNNLLQDLTFFTPKYFATTKRTWRAAGTHILKMFFQN